MSAGGSGAVEEMGGKTRLAGEKPGRVFDNGVDDDNEDDNDDDCAEEVDGREEVVAVAVTVGICFVAGPDVKLEDGTDGGGALEAPRLVLATGAAAAAAARGSTCFPAA